MLPLVLLWQGINSYSYADFAELWRDERLRLRKFMGIENDFAQFS